jgi:predicted nucleic acid-binding protein
VPVVLTDSGPLISLAKIIRLQILRDLWGTVHITEKVYQEAVTFGQAQGAPDALTIRLFWQRHKLPLIAVPEDVLASYEPAISLHGEWKEPF